MASYNERVEELNAVTQERDDIKRQYDEWRKKRLACFLSLFILSAALHCFMTEQNLMFRLDEFMAGFNTISLKLKEMYQVCAQYIVIFTPHNYISKTSGRHVGLGGISKYLQRPALRLL